MFTPIKIHLCVFEFKFKSMKQKACLWFERLNSCSQREHEIHCVETSATHNVKQVFDTKGGMALWEVEAFNHLPHVVIAWEEYYMWWVSETRTSHSHHKTPLITRTSCEFQQPYSSWVILTNVTTWEEGRLVDWKYHHRCSLMLLRYKY